MKAHRIVEVVEAYHDTMHINPPRANPRGYRYGSSRLSSRKVLQTRKYEWPSSNEGSGSP